MSGAVAVKGETIWAEAVGLADAEAGREATPDDQYRIGSVTKTFTAVAVLRLRDDGRLSLDDGLAEHIPDCPLGGPTIRRLLSHASGLQREIPGTTWETMVFPEREPMLAGLDKAEQVLGAGEHWHYSNLAFALLGEVVANRSGMPYERYVEETILRPLGLERTTWQAAEPAAHPYFVEPYSDTVRAEPDVDLAGGASAGQLWSTTGDLLRWGGFFCDPDPDVLRPATVEEMHAPQIMVDPDRWTSGWGLGLMLARKGERVFAGHPGGMPGFRSAVVWSRKEHIVAAVLTNTTANVNPEELVVELAEKTADAYPAEPEPWRPGEPAPPELAGVLGRWWSEGTETVFSFRDGRLEARRADDPADKEPAVFAPDGPNRFRVVSGRERGELLEIVRNERGDVAKLYWATYPFERAPSTF